MPFSSTLKNFYENGLFELTNAQIFFEHIVGLKKEIQHLKDDKPRIHNYEIDLKNISVIPGLLPREGQKQLLTGRANEHENRSWNEKFPDAFLAQMATVNEFNIPLNFMDTGKDYEINLDTLAQSLIFLLVQPDFWNSVKLERLFFYKKDQIDYKTTRHFYNSLLNSLAQNESLKALSIKPFSLSQHRKGLVDFLTQHTELEVLQLEVIEANGQDWLELCQILSTHPKLKSFHLDDNSLLDANAYSALVGLLDENYRIEISLPEPTECALLEAYEPLKQRLSKTGLERFKEDHLAQDKLLHVALTALDFIQKLRSTDQIKKQVLFKKQFDFLIANEGQLAITHYQKEDWAKSINVLPLIYQNHTEYLKNESSLVRLQMDKLVADGSKTIGYVLMEKALETQNGGALEFLLNTNINLFEFPNDGKDPFLVKALQSRWDLKRLVVEHIRQDERLTERSSEYLAIYPDLSNLFKEFKDHLDGYAAHLVKKDNPPILLSLAKQILITWRKILGIENPSSKRVEECAQIYLKLDKSLQIISQTAGEYSYDYFNEVHKIIIKMKEDSIKTLKGFFNTSLLHQEILNLIRKFEIQLLDTKKVVVDKKDEVINHLEENHRREKAFLNEKFEQAEAKRAEAEAKLAEMEEKLKELQQRTSNHSYPLEESSTSQDQSRTETRGFFRP